MIPILSNLTRLSLTSSWRTSLTLIAVMPLAFGASFSRSWSL